MNQTDQKAKARGGWGGVKGIAVIWGGLLLLTSLGAVLGDNPKKHASNTIAAAQSASADDAEFREPQKAPTEPAVDSSPDLEVDAARLWRDYDDNEVAADNSYKGKRLRVTGILDSIDKNVFGDIVLRLKVPDEFSSALAALEESEASRAAALRKRMRVRLVCDGQGLIMGSPSLGECKIESAQ